MEDGDVQVANLYVKMSPENIDVFVGKLSIHLMKEAAKRLTPVEKCVEKPSRLLVIVNANTNALNFVILDLVLHV